MRPLLLTIAILFFVFSALNFMNLFKFDNNFSIAGASLIMGIVFVALQDYAFYKQVKKRQAKEKAAEDARLHAQEQYANS